MPVDVFLDSSAIRAGLNLNSSKLARLRELVELGVVNVHLHEVVRREVVTGVSAELRAAIPKVLPYIDWCSPSGAALGDGLRRLEPDPAPSVTLGVQQMLSGLRAQEHPLDPATTVAVFDSYFSGKAPFSSVKNRRDIPDAFIYQSIVALIRRLPSLHVVCGDDCLRGAAQSLGLPVFPRVIDFLDCEAVKEEVRELRDREEALALDLQKQQAVDEVREALQNANQHIKDVALEFIHGERNPQVRHERIPSDSNEATVRDWGELVEFDFIMDEVDSLGGGEVVLPIELNFVDATLDFFVFRGSLSELDEEQLSWTGGVWNDHYVEGEVLAALRVRAVARIQMERHEDGQDLIVIGASFDGIDEIEVSELIS